MTWAEYLEAANAIAIPLGAWLGIFLTFIGLTRIVSAAPRVEVQDVHTAAPPSREEADGVVYFDENDRPLDRYWLRVPLEVVVRNVGRSPAFQVLVIASNVRGSLGSGADIRSMPRTLLAADDPSTFNIDVTAMVEGPGPHSIGMDIWAIGDAGPVLGTSVTVLVSEGAEVQFFQPMRRGYFAALLANASARIFMSRLEKHGRAKLRATDMPFFEAVRTRIAILKGARIFI